MKRRRKTRDGRRATAITDSCKQPTNKKTTADGNACKKSTSSAVVAVELFLVSRLFGFSAFGLAMI